MTDILDSYEVRYRETDNNPIYAWLALMESLDCELDIDTQRLVYVGRDCGIPRWVMSYIATIGSRLIALATDGERKRAKLKKLSPGAKAKWVSKALDFTRQGRNAFRNYEVDEFDAGMTLKHDYGIALALAQQGLDAGRGREPPDEQAVLAAKRAHIKAASAFLNSQPPAVRGRMRKARAQWDAQDPTRKTAPKTKAKRPRPRIK